MDTREKMFVSLASSPEARLPPASLPAHPLVRSDAMSAEAKAPTEIYDELIPFKETPHLVAQRPVQILTSGNATSC